jgi:hypothetical protein
MRKTAIVCTNLLPETFTSTAGNGFVETQCHRKKLLSEAHRQRAVSKTFDGGKIISDAEGLLLLREVEEQFGFAPLVRRRLHGAS